jgi:integrase
MAAELASIPAGHGGERRRTMAIEKLNMRQVERLRRPGYYNDGGGLYLRVTEDGNKSWVFRFRLTSGRLRQMGLGSANTFSVKEAREHARAARQQRYAGIDPIEARREQRQGAAVRRAAAMTFRECAEAYIAAHSPAWKNPRHAAQWPATLTTYAYPIVGALPVQAVDTALVIKVVQPIWERIPETAGRVRGRLETVLDWATARGYRTGENPARWRGHLENLLPHRSKIARVEHHAALPYGELPAFMAELRSIDSISSRCLQFAILTCARTGEAIGAPWEEIDLDERLWSLPAERMKGERPHRVALSRPAMEILREMHAMRSGPYVFPGQRPGQPLSQMALLMLLRRLDRKDLTVHGFRSTFADWCAERTNFPSELREMALAHAVGSKVEQAYRRGDLFAKRRQLGEAWARFCTTPVVGVTEATPIRA